MAQMQPRATFPISLHWSEIFQVFKWNRLAEPTNANAEQKQKLVYYWRGVGDTSHYKTEEKITDS